MSDTGTVFPGTVNSLSAAPWSDNDWVTPANASAEGGGTAWIVHTSYDSGDQSYLLRAQTFNFSAVPDGATIQGVVCNIKTWYANGSVSMDFLTLLNTTGGTVGTNMCSTKAPLGTAVGGTITKGGTGDTWGNALDSAWVKDADFGVAVGFLADANDADVFVDYISLVVYYSGGAISGTVTGVVATSPAAMIAPVLSGDGSVLAVFAASPAEMIAPVLSGVGSVDAVLAASSSAMPAPVMSSEGIVIAVTATSPAAMIAPAVSASAHAVISWIEFETPAASGNGSVTAVVGTASAAGVAPALSGAGSVTGVVGTASGTGVSPALAGSGSVTGTVATANAAAIPPTVTGEGGGDASVIAVVGTATGAGLPPVLSASSSITGMVGTASAQAGAPVISADAVLTFVVATADASAGTPVLSSGVNLAGVAATASAGMGTPTVTGFSASDGLVTAVLIVATASMLAPVVANTPSPSGRSRSMVRIDYAGGRVVKYVRRRH